MPLLNRARHPAHACGMTEGMEEKLASILRSVRERQGRVVVAHGSRDLRRERDPHLPRRGGLLGRRVAELHAAGDGHPRDVPGGAGRGLALVPPPVRHLPRREAERRARRARRARAGDRRSLHPRHAEHRRAPPPRRIRSGSTASTATRPGSAARASAASGGWTCLRRCRSRGGRTRSPPRSAPRSPARGAGRGSARTSSVRRVLRRGELPPRQRAARRRPRRPAPRRGHERRDQPPHADRGSSRGGAGPRWWT